MRSLVNQKINTSQRSSTSHFIAKSTGILRSDHRPSSTTNKQSSVDDENHLSAPPLGVNNFHQISVLPPSAFPLQPKLMINTPGDKYEQEADRVADQVMRKPKTNVQEKCSQCSQGESRLQTKAIGNAGGMASPSLTHKIRNTQGQGQPMGTNNQAFMASRFGMDFSGVRIHADNQAAEMNREINARAFTVGRDIYFGRAAYKPGEVKGRELLAHELTHVVQQRGTTGSIQRETADQQSTESSNSEAVKDNSKDTASSKETNLPLSASVGREGINNIGDLRLIQDKLLELGLLSLANYGAEYPLDQMPSLKIAALHSQESEKGAASTADTEKVESTTPQNTTISGENINNTIAAIEEFQRLIFHGWSDGTIDVGEKQTTLTRLRNTDKPGLEKLRAAEKKRLESERLAKEQKEKEKRKAAFLKSPRAQALKMRLAKSMLKRYSTSIELAGVEVFLNVNDEELGAALAAKAKDELNIILEVFDLLPSVDRDDVALSLSKNLADEQLPEIAPDVLKRIRSELVSGVTFSDEKLEIKRINKVLGDGEVESTGGDHVDFLKEQVNKRVIIFDNSSKILQNQLLNENLEKGSVRATNKLQGLLVYLSSLGEQIRVSSVSTGTHKKESLHYSGRGVDIGNEEIGPKVLPGLVENVAKLHIDEIIYDASIDGLDANLYNYDKGSPHTYGQKTLQQHRNHIHLSVKE